MNARVSLSMGSSLLVAAMLAACSSSSGGTAGGSSGAAGDSSLGLGGAGPGAGGAGGGPVVVTGGAGGTSAAGSSATPGAGGMTFGGGGTTGTGGSGKGGSASAGKGGSSPGTGGMSAGGGGAPMDCGTTTAKTDCYGCCDAQTNNGYSKAISFLINDCACTAGSTCATQCMTTPLCTDPMSTAMPDPACVMCLNGLKGMEACYMKLQMDCTADPDCIGGVQCAQAAMCSKKM